MFKLLVIFGLLAITHVYAGLIAAPAIAVAPAPIITKTWAAPAAAWGGWNGANGWKGAGGWNGAGGWGGAGGWDGNIGLGVKLG